MAPDRYFRTHSDLRFQQLTKGFNRLGHITDQPPDKLCGTTSGTPGFPLNA